MKKIKQQQLTNPSVSPQEKVDLDPSQGQEGSTASSTSSSSSIHSLKKQEVYSLKGTNVIVEDLIAQGGFGVVYMVKNVSNKTSYALKRIVVNNEQDYKIVSRELNIMNSLHHPNLVSTIDYNVIHHQGNHIHEVLMLMPYIKVNLHSIVQQNYKQGTHMATGQLLQIARDVVNGLSRLHHCATPIIHRDIKVENVLFEPHANKYMICDFGSCTPEVLNPKTHSINNIKEEIEKFTTLSYRAPEMVDFYGEYSGPITTKIDIWAVGVVLYKTTYYSLPFGESILAIQSLNVNYPVTEHYTKEFNALLNYCFQPDYSRRPDVYQLSCILNSLIDFYKVSNLPPPTSTIQNINNSTVPTIQNIVDLYTEQYVDRKNNKKKDDGIIINKNIEHVSIETSVTPRQRPKSYLNVVPPNDFCSSCSSNHCSCNGSGNHSAGGSGGSAAVGSSSGNHISKIQPPPKSPSLFKSEQRQQQQAPPPAPQSQSSQQQSKQPQPVQSLPQPQTQPPPPPPPSTEKTNWNPFDSMIKHENNNESNEDPNDDPFANAPFDVEMIRTSLDLFGSAPFSNPFLNFDETNHNDGVDPPIMLAGEEGNVNLNFQS